MADRELVELAEKHVVEAAVAFVDQLCSFNEFYHPAVHTRAKALAAAVQDMLITKSQPDGALAALRTVREAMSADQS